MSSKEIILGRIRKSLSDGFKKDMPDWKFGQPNPRCKTREEVIDLFVERVEDYKATVVRVAKADVPKAIVEGLKQLQAKTVVLPKGLDKTWRDAIAAAGVEIKADEPPLDRKELNVINAVVTASAGGFAETGTIVLNHDADQGRRALSLVPDIHICVIREDQVATDVTDGLAVVAKALREASPVTWISGPSATSDIELNRVEGVHGPRTLYVIVAK